MLGRMSPFPFYDSDSRRKRSSSLPRASRPRSLNYHKSYFSSRIKHAKTSTDFVKPTQDFTMVNHLHATHDFPLCPWEALRSSLFPENSQRSILPYQLVRQSGCVSNDSNVGGTRSTKETRDGLREIGCRSADAWSETERTTSPCVRPKHSLYERRNTRDSRFSPHGPRRSCFSSGRSSGRSSLGSRCSTQETRHSTSGSRGCQQAVIKRLPTGCQERPTKNEFRDTSVTRKSQKEKKQIPTTQKYPVAEGMHHTAANSTSAESSGQIQESTNDSDNEQFMVIFAPGGRFIRKRLCRTESASLGRYSPFPCMPSISKREDRRLIKRWSRQGRGWNSESFDSTDSSSSVDELNICPHQLQPFKLCSCEPKTDESVQEHITSLETAGEKHVPVREVLSTSTQKDVVESLEEEDEGVTEGDETDGVKEEKDEGVDIDRVKVETEDENKGCIKTEGFKEEVTSIPTSKPQSSISLKCPTLPDQAVDPCDLNDCTQASVHERLPEERVTVEEDTNQSDEPLPTSELSAQIEDTSMPDENEVRSPSQRSVVLRSASAADVSARSLLTRRPTPHPRPRGQPLFQKRPHDRDTTSEETVETSMQSPSDHEVLPTLSSSATSKPSTLDDSTMDTSTNSLSSMRGRYRVPRKCPLKRRSKLKTKSIMANGSRCPLRRPNRVCPSNRLNYPNALALSSDSKETMSSCHFAPGAVSVHGEPAHVPAMSCNCSSDTSLSRSGQTLCLRCGENLQIGDEAVLRAELLKYARLAERAPLLWRRLLALILFTHIVALFYLHGSVFDFFCSSPARP